MKKLDVHITWKPRGERRVGQLAEKGGRVFFEYDPEFLRDPLWLSPFKLPPEPGLVEHRDLDFGPLFGLFDDSLPDGWGLVLMDRFFARRGTPKAELSPLDRLAWLGTRTMGALTYHPPSDPDERVPRSLDLHAMAAAADEVLHGEALHGRAEEVLPQLIRAGGSPGGARPKVLVGVSGDEILSGEAELPPGFEPWMIKFHGHGDDPDAGAVELAYSTMARAAGIAMPATRLFETAQGECFFGVERFDRAGARRHHVHTFGNLIQANFRIPSCDYEQFLEVTSILTRNLDDLLEAFRRTAFNVLAHNRDDHVKNFAFRLREDEDWKLAPAYDLVFADGPGGEHTMTVAGEGRAPGREHLLALAASAGLASGEAAEALAEVASAVADWPAHARRAGVGRLCSRKIEKALAPCLERARPTSP